MASLNFEQWNAWSTEVQNEHSKLNNTDCCVCYSYCVLNNSICSECKNYVCKECSEKLEYNECPICRKTGIVSHRSIEPPRENIRNDAINYGNNEPPTITGIAQIVSHLYRDHINFVMNYPRNNTERNNTYEPQDILFNNHMLNPINNIPNYNIHQFMSIHPPPTIQMPRQM